MKLRRYLFWNGRAALMDGYAPFEVEFVKWSDETDIALCSMPSGKLVKAPNFALEGFDEAAHPQHE